MANETNELGRSIAEHFRNERKFAEDNTPLMRPLILDQQPPEDAAKLAEWRKLHDHSEAEYVEKLLMHGQLSETEELYLKRLVVRFLKQEQA